MMAPDADGLNEAAEFLTGLYEAAEDGWLTIWSKSDSDSRTDWAKASEPLVAAAAAIGRAGDSNVWFGVATRREKLGQGRRGGIGDCLEMPALWADIDIAGPNHAVGDDVLPKTVEEALALVEAVGLAPSVVVHSGGGLHAYWLFQEMQPVTELVEAGIVARWQATLERLAGARGWHIDNVSNPDRVLRVPGTLNFKHNPVQARILSADYGLRYGLDDVVEILDPPAEPVEPAEASADWSTPAMPYVGPERPGDAFNLMCTGDDVLRSIGWTVHHEDRNGDRYYQRPGSSNDYGAIVHFSGQTAIFSSTMPMQYPAIRLATEGHTYNPFGLYAAIHHRGDHSAAAAELRRLGYGASGDPDAFWQVEGATPASAGDEPEDDDEEPWPAPEPFDIVTGFGPPCPMTSVLPAWIARHVYTVSRTVTVPVDYGVGTVLGVLSALTMNRAVLDVAEGQMGEPLNLWIGVGGESGEGKSYPFKEMMRPLRDFIAAREDDYRTELRRKQAELLAEKKNYEELQKRATASSQGVSALADELFKAEMKVMEAEDALPANPHFTTGDITPEALTDFYGPHDDLAFIASDEGEVIDMMTGAYAKSNANPRPYIAGYDRSALEVTRKGSGTTNVANPCLAICVMTQPMMLERLGADDYLAGKGITPRFVLAIPPCSTGWKSYDFEHSAEDREAKVRYERTVIDLATRLAAYSPERPLRLTASPAAYERLKEWKRANEPRLRSGGDLWRLRSWYQKIRTATVRAAALLHLAFDPQLVDTEVSVEDFERAFVLADYWVEHAKVLVATWAQRDAQKRDRQLDHAQALVRWLIDHEGQDVDGGPRAGSWSLAEVPWAVLTRRMKNCNGLAKEKTIDVLDVLVDKGWARVPEGFFDRVKLQTRGGPRKGEWPLTVAFHPESAIWIQKETSEAPDLGLSQDVIDAYIGLSTGGVRGEREFGVSSELLTTTTLSNYPNTARESRDSDPHTHPRSELPFSPNPPAVDNFQAEPQNVVDAPAEDDGADDDFGGLF
jgi:hypothetical protein